MLGVLIERACGMIGVLVFAYAGENRWILLFDFALGLKRNRS